MVESRFYQFRQARLRDAETRGDQVGIKTSLARACDEFFQVGPSSRFAAGQMQVQNAEAAGFLKYAEPFFGGKFSVRGNQLQRVGAIDAVQRTTMRQLGDQRQRIRNHS